MIKVIIKRNCIPGQETRLEGLLTDLRVSCMRNISYISGETLVKVDNPQTYITIGTWTRVEGWKGWQNCQERQELLQMVAVCIDSEPSVSVYSALGNSFGGFEMDEYFSSLISESYLIHADKGMN